MSDRDLLALRLADEGYDVETASNGLPALRKYDSFRPDVVVTDLFMPEMDGIELIRKIRETEDPAEVVVMTARGSKDTALDAMREGAAAYLTKPVSVGELLVILDKAFETQKLRREARQLRARVRDLHYGLDGVALEMPPPRIPGATMAELERYAILQTLKATGGSTSRAAEVLGVSEHAIQDCLHRCAEESHRQAGTTDTPEKV